MKKKLLKGFIATFIIMAGSMNVNAQEWNFSSGSFGVATSYTETTTVDGLTIYATSTASFSIAASSKQIEDYAFTYCIKTGGTGTFDATSGLPVSRILAFPVSGNTNIKIIATHASNSGDNRFLVVAAGSKTNEVGRLEVTPGTLSSQTFTYTGGATTIYLFSASSGINIYLIKLLEVPTGIVETKKDLVSTEYFDTTGLKTNKNATGLILEKRTYSDGSISTIKTLNEK